MQRNKLSYWRYLILATVLGLSSAQASARVEELPDPRLPDIATVRFLPGKGAIIVYNPILCRQAGPALCEFYRYHEYAHIVLRHNDRNGLSIRDKEREADQWAAKRAPKVSVIAAYRFFASGGGTTPQHGESYERAARVLNGNESLFDQVRIQHQPPLNRLREHFALVFGGMAL